jgi:signal peptidase II
LTKFNSRQLWFLGCAWLIVGLDQLIKSFLLETLTPGKPVELFGSLVKLNLAFNDSAAFSIGFGATWIFTIISSLAALVLIWYSFKIETVGWSVMAGVLLGGVVGNLIDRLIRDPGFGIGHVIDYIQIPFNFPIFNIADMAIFTMCSLSVIRILRGDSIGRKPVSK